jgi:hypothetical protein
MTRLHAAAPTLPTPTQAPVRRHGHAHPAPTLSQLARDAFLCRHYSVGNASVAGQGLDMFRHHGREAVEGAVQVGAGGLSPVLATAMLGKVAYHSGELTAHFQQIRDGLSHLRGRPVASPPPGSHGHAPLTGRLGKVLAPVQRVGAAGGVVLATVAGPAMVTEAARSVVHLGKTLTDGHTDRQDKLLAVARAGYANGTLLLAAAAIPHGLETLGEGKGKLGRLATSAMATRTGKVIDRVAHRGLPLADGLLLVADGARAWQLAGDDEASGGMKARGYLAAGLSATRVLARFAPRSPVAAAGYTLAGLSQLALTGYEAVTGQPHQHLHDLDHTGHDHDHDHDHDHQG